MSVSFSASTAAASIRVGWIGTGVMGKSMAGHLQRAGHPLAVFTRTPAKAGELVEAGASVARTPRELAMKSDLVFSCVAFPKDVRSVLLDPETGALAGLQKGSALVDMTTTEPSLAREVALKGGEKGVGVLDAPVSGGDAGARNAALSIMCGGDAAVFAAVEPVLRRMGTPKLLGGAGAGQATKMGNQITIASTMVGLCEGMVYAHRAGLNMEDYIEAIQGGAAGSKSLELYAGRILQGDMAPGFFVEHFVKDLGIALRECEATGIALPGLSLAHSLYLGVVAKGGARNGTQALIEVLAEMNGTTLKKT